MAKDLQIHRTLNWEKKSSPRPSLSLPSVCAQQFQSVLIFFPSICLRRWRRLCRPPWSNWKQNQSNDRLIIVYKNYLLKTLLPKLKVSFYTAMPIFCSGSRLSDKGGGGDHPDPNMRGGGVGLQKLCFRHLGPQIGLKIREDRGPAGPFPRSATAIYNYLYNSVST